MTLLLVSLLALGQADAPPSPPAVEAPPPAVEAAPPASAPAPAVAPPAAEPPVQSDPGWARAGSIAGFALAGVPLAFGIGSVVALWTHHGTAQDWLTVGAGLSAPLIGLIPTFASRSAVLRYDELTRRPRIFRIVGWVMTIYGSVALLGGVLGGQVFKAISHSADFHAFESGTAADVLAVFGTVSTLFDAALCSAGIVLLSMSSQVSADRAEAYVQPSVAAVPTPNGGFAVMAGFSGRL
ncbi:MAG: hypothetical protein IPJ65_01690 [Archangiaceae bacterium]|nr:hypothetical protein [Archangiaceae bacterium]